MSTLAIEYLFQQVSARFTADGILAVNEFGWRVPTQHPFGPRVAWVPGDPSNSAGLSTAPRGPGGQPRALGMLRELCTVYFTAQDPADPENELTQYHIVRMLHDAWYRALYHAGHGTFYIQSTAWESKRSERRFGATLRVVFEVLAPILDILPDPPLVDPGIDRDLVVDAVADAHANDTVVSPDTNVAMVSLTKRQLFVALTTVADGDLASADGVSFDPGPDVITVRARVGNTAYEVGNGGTAGVPLYVSGDGGVSARAWGDIAPGDTLHWQGSVAGFELDAASYVISLYVETQDI